MARWTEPERSEEARLLLEIGEAVWGREFRGEMAAALGVTVNTLGKWLADKQPVPAGVWRDLVVVLNAHAGIVVGLAEQAQARATGE
jgi:hypothetical protein